MSIYNYTSLSKGEAVKRAISATSGVIAMLYKTSYRKHGL